VRQLAWLHAVPEGSKKSRLASYTDDDSTFLQFPELDGAGYLVNLLQEAGLIMSNGMGVVPLTWQEIESWLRVTELRLSVWEKLIIREMSEAYAAELANLPTNTPHRRTRHRLLKLIALPSLLRCSSILRGFKRKEGALTRE
jgi:hypothetical protein